MVCYVLSPHSMEQSAGWGLSVSPSPCACMDYPWFLLQSKDRLILNSSVMSKCFLAWFLCVSSVLHCWLVQGVSPMLVFVIGPDPNMDKQFKKARLYETGCFGKKECKVKIWTCLILSSFFTSNYHIVMFFREQWLANLARDSEIWWKTWFDNEQLEQTVDELSAFRIPWTMGHLDRLSVES